MSRSRRVGFSWAGMESYRDQIHALAREVVESDSVVRGMFHSSVATGMICEAMRDPSTAAYPEVARAAKAQNDLFELHSLLMTKGLDFDFVRREWATIIDPSPEERALCDKLAGY